ncbi:MAG: HAD family hydrolase [Alphaproteobacteria bacterium]
MDIRAVLFDKDGTLLDFTATWEPIYREVALEQFAGDADAAQALLAAGGFDAATSTFAPDSLLGSGTTDQIVDAWWPGCTGDARAKNIAALDQGFAEKARRYSSPILPDPALPELFTVLKAMGLVLGVATNDNEASAHAGIHRLGLGPKVDFVAGYDSVAAAKPAPDMLLAFCDACGLAPHQVAMVGDTITDLETGHAASAGAIIGVLSGNGRHADLAPRADVLLANVGELPAFLRGKTGQGE